MQSTTSSTRTFMKPSVEPSAPKKLPRLPTGKLTLPWLIVIVLIVASIFLFFQYREAKNKLKASTPAAATKQVKDTVAQVRTLIILPPGEQPTIVTVKDASKLKSEKFYADARDGDITLVYSKAQKAILYRPSAHIIVNAAPVTVTQNSAAAQ